MNRILMAIIFFCFSCKKKIKEPIVSDQQMTTKAVLNKKGTKTNCLKNSVEYENFEKEGFSLIEFKGVNPKIELILINETEKSFLILNDKVSRTHFNFTYDTDKEQSLTGVRFFSCVKDELIILLPTATEELELYQMIKINTKNDIEDLGLISYEVMDPEKMFKSNNVEKLELVNNKYFYKIKEKKTGTDILVYNKAVIDSFKEIKSFFPNVETYLNLRSKPSVKESRIISKLYPSDKISLLNNYGEWSLVFSNHTYGYVSSDYVK